jgi:uncharacterized protein YhbP (UPF0306 family)
MKENHKMKIQVNMDLAQLIGLSTMTLSTSGPTGEPHAAAVYFAAGEGLELYFFSDENSQHSQDTAHHSQAAITIYPECRDWQDIRGLQMRGEVRAVENGPEWDAAWAIYAAKFPFVGELKAVVGRNRLYVFEPYWVRLVDNRQGFGFKKEWIVDNKGRE